MTGFWFQLFALLAAVNPAAAALMAGSALRVRQGLIGASVAFVLLVLATLVATPLVDWLEVAPESFRTAAGIVMAVHGALMVWSPKLNYGAPETNAGAFIPLGWPVIANAAAVLAVVSFAADASNGQVIGVAAIAAAGAGGTVVLAAGRFGDSLTGVARLSGAILIVAAAALIVSGVRDV